MYFIVYFKFLEGLFHGSFGFYLVANHVKVAQSLLDSGIQALCVCREQNISNMNRESNSYEVQFINK